MFFFNNLSERTTTKLTPLVSLDRIFKMVFMKLRIASIYRNEGLKIFFSRETKKQNEDQINILHGQYCQHNCSWKLLIFN
jgi:hypothetical protein